jgi:predicted permease
MTIFVGIIFALAFAALLWCAPFFGWKPQEGRRHSGERRWLIDFILMEALLLLTAIELGAHPSWRVMVAAFLLAAAASYGIQLLRNRNARHRQLSASQSSEQ